MRCTVRYIQIMFCLFVNLEELLWLSGRRSQILNHEVPGSNLLAAAVVPLGKALYPHCLVPRKDLKPLVPWLLAYKQLAFLVAR